MKTLSTMAFAFLAVGALISSTANGAGYDWRQKITYANHPYSSSSHDYVQRRTYLAEPPQEVYRTSTHQAGTPCPHAQQAAAISAFKPGDTLTVASAGASLKVGDRVVATVARGQRIIVSNVSGSWIGTSVEQDGRQISGWISPSELVVDRTASKSVPAAVAQPAAFRAASAGAPTVYFVPSNVAPESWQHTNQNDNEWRADHGE
jgi:hypothetical protein